MGAQVSHTPAPWTVEMGDQFPGEADRVYGIYAGNKRLVETDSGFYYLSVEDARLIAAAPELLEACLVAFAELENHKGVPGVLEHVLPCISAAIASATGAQS
jgi:hypothetical protein